MSLCHSLADMIGRTPLLEARRFRDACGLSARLLLKLERCNPTGSAKDRAALQMILEAEEQGLLRPGAVIVEPTSGNTGIGLAAVGAARGYRVVLTMPDTMSAERRALLAAYGAELILTDGSLGMTGAVEEAHRLVGSIPGGWLAGQFENSANPRAHYLTTGPEIWQDTEGRVDIFVAGAGTGGTLTGVGRYLKEQNPAVKIVAVEPSSSPLLTEGRSGSHGLQGIGADFVPKTLDLSLIDEVIPVTEEDAYAAARLLVGTEGLLCGITSGAALHAAALLARRRENAGKSIVALLPDSGERYLSTPLFAE